LLVLQAIVSYRSVPRILALFNSISHHPLGWVPHFTSVINWTLRMGLGLLKQVKPINKSWVAIIDHSIDIGTKKALVVLRVTLDALSRRGSAICLEDCECIGLKVSEKVDGENVSRDLEQIFSQAGRPDAIIKDCDRTLHKGVMLYQEHRGIKVPVIEDIGHVMAAALKSQFEKTEDYKIFTSLVSKGGKSLRQTALAFLTPPKLRSKGRFQSIGKLGEWADKVLDILDKSVGGDDEQKDGLLDKLHKALPDFIQSRPFIKRFSSTATVLSQVMNILKNKGLDQASYEQCRQLSEQFPDDSKVRERLLEWLRRHIEIKNKITPLSLLVSSDIIESLFGNFKHIVERSPQADMNRTTLLIPALCGKMDKVTITLVLSQTSHKDLKAWEEENIPYTMRKRRQAFFAQQKARNRSINIIDSGGISTA
jgi:hypothetical protein